MSATILAIANQKGGVGKTTTTANLGIGLARTGKRVLLIDADPQASLTISLGYANPDNFPVTLTQLLQVTAQIGTPRPGEGILHHAEGVDLLPSNIELCSMEMALINVLSRETTMKRLLEPMKKQYDYILIDCMPSLGQLTINALAAADSVIIPVQAHYLSLKGLEQLYDTCRKIRTQINPNLKIEGILPTMVDNRTKEPKTKSLITQVANPSYPSHQGEQDKVEQVRQEVKQQVCYDVLVQSVDQELLNELVGLIVETLCDKARTIRIGSHDYPAALVQERMRQIDSFCLEYVCAYLRKSNPNIRNIKQYLLMALFNASVTMSHYYYNKAQNALNDWYTGGIANEN